MKKIILSCAVCLASSVSYATAQYEELAKKMEESIAGGKKNPRIIRVKNIESRFFLEGSVDSKAQQDEALAICQSFVASRVDLKRSGFEHRSDLCVDSIRIRMGIPEEPSPIIRVEYRVIEIPDLKVSSAMMLKSGFYEENNLPRGSRILKSLAFEVNDNFVYLPLSGETIELRQPASAPREPMKMIDKDPSGLSLSLQVSARSLAGSDKIRLHTDLTLLRDGREKHINSQIDATNHQQTALAAWTESDGSQMKGVLILVILEKMRTPNSDTIW